MGREDREGREQGVERTGEERTVRREDRGRERVGDMSGSGEDREFREQGEERTVRRGHVKKDREERGQ